jgi:5'-nucleotidase
MRVLLTNDDGIWAKGIEALFEALSTRHEVTVVAPETEQSAIGHAITFLEPLKVKPVKRNGHFFGYALNGTPADCVKLAVRELVKPVPDVVVSGINLGANVGVNVIYSGTVSAATEGAVLGLPAIAVSIDSYRPRDFGAATSIVLRLLDLVNAEGLPAGVSLNVNVPDVPPEKVRGVKITHQGNLKFFESYDRRIDPRQNVYYWLTGSAPCPDEDPGCDVHMLSERYISITPIRYDLTSYKTLEPLKSWGLEGE